MGVVRWPLRMIEVHGGVWERGRGCWRVLVVGFALTTTSAGDSPVSVLVLRSQLAVAAKTREQAAPYAVDPQECRLGAAPSAGERNAKTRWALAQT